jgi:hypothetical protein
MEVHTDSVDPVVVNRFARSLKRHFLKGSETPKIEKDKVSFFLLTILMLLLNYGKK